MLVSSLIGNSNRSSAALFFFSEQKLSPESKRLHVLREMPNDANRNQYRQNQESKAIDVSNKVQQRRKVTFQDHEDNSANVVVEHCLSAVFEEYKETIFPKGTYINYSCCIC